jgi:hypothetical protein
MDKIGPFDCGMGSLLERKICPPARLQDLVSLWYLALECAASIMLLALKVVPLFGCRARWLRNWLHSASMFWVADAYAMPMALSVHKSLLSTACA